MDAARDDAAVNGTKLAQRQAALTALFAAVEAAPYNFDFFALMRRMESLRPDSPRIGKASRPSQEALRLGQEPELDFAPAALATFAHEGGAAPRLGVRFFGLLGSQGPMPLHLTEYVRERLRHRNDPTLARFLDIFHHRLLSLFYRAWAQSQPAVQHDRPAEAAVPRMGPAPAAPGAAGRRRLHLVVVRASAWTGPDGTRAARTRSDSRRGAPPALRASGGCSARCRPVDHAHRSRRDRAGRSGCGRPGTGGRSVGAPSGSNEWLATLDDVGLRRTSGDPAVRP